MPSTPPPDFNDHDRPGSHDPSPPEPPASAASPVSPEEARTEAVPVLRSPLGVGIVLTGATLLAGIIGTLMAALAFNVPGNPGIELRLLSRLIGHGLGAIIGVQALLLLQRATILTFEDLGLHVSGDLWRRIRYGIGIYILSFPGYILVFWIMKYLGDRYGFTYEQPAIQGIVKQVLDNPVATAIFFLVAAVGAPVWEETMFRGLLYPALRSRWGVAVAMLLTAFLFTLLHEFSRVIQDPRTFLLPIFYLGIVLAFVRERTQSVVPGMVVHALHNGVALVVTLNFRELAG